MVPYALVELVTCKVLIEDQAIIVLHHVVPRQAVRRVQISIS
jgi:hypothetical protein